MIRGVAVELVRVGRGLERRPGRRDEEKKEKKSSGIGAGWTTVAFLGGLAALLGLKRNRDKKHRDDKSSYMGYGSSYYSGYSSELLMLICWVMDGFANVVNRF